MLLSRVRRTRGLQVAARKPVTWTEAAAEDRDAAHFPQEREALLSRRLQEAKG